LPVERAQFEQWIPVPIEKVFLFFANPQNLPRIMPPSTGTRLTKLTLKPPPPNSPVADMSSLAGIGSEIETSFLLLPFLPVRAGWTALITEFEWNHHFADIQKRGPFRSFHHRHEFVSEERGQVGTLIRDVIDFEVGYGILGSIAQNVFVRRELEKTFAYRQRALSRMAF
jgi:ligand-binding SRPBCC domain-containing protein